MHLHQLHQLQKLLSNTKLLKDSKLLSKKNRENLWETFFIEIIIQQLYIAT